MCMYSLKYIETAKINLKMIGGPELSLYSKINLLSDSI